MNILATTNEKQDGFHIESDYSRSILKTWFKKYRAFTITPIIRDSVKSRGYLEGAVIPAYCKWQYGVDERDPGKSEQRRLLFKRDFNYEVIKNRNGQPIRAPMSSKGRVNEILSKYTEWATENGAPIPNPDLFKLYRDKWSMDDRFPSFHDFIEFLGMECDAMPSPQTLSKLGKFA